jgi:hypothetical protein
LAIQVEIHDLVDNFIFYYSSMGHFITLIVGLLATISLVIPTTTHAQIAPSFNQNFARYLTDETPDEF